MSVNEGFVESAQIYRIAIVFSPYIRAFVLRMRYRRIKRECIEMVIGKSYVGDWFLIYLMGQVAETVLRL
jgi:uncharacterized membrane protein